MAVMEVFIGMTNTDGQLPLHHCYFGPDICYSLLHSGPTDLFDHVCKPGSLAKPLFLLFEYWYLR